MPGGKAAYPSSLLMNAIPAHVAGVGEIIMVVPTPRRAASLTGGAAIVTQGRAQRAACWRPPTWPASRAPLPSAARRPWPRWPMVRRPFPRSTRSPAPASAYVAGRQAPRVRLAVGIDMIAGPSEILGAGRRRAPPPTGWRWTCSARPSTTSSRARASCSAPTPPTSTACRPRSTACCRPCRARRSSPPPCSTAAAR